MKGETMRWKREVTWAGIPKPYLNRMDRRVTWKDKALEVGLVIVVTFLFWLPAILGALSDYAIQKHPVMATQNAVVTQVHNGRNRTYAEVSYTTNTGERVDTNLGYGLFQCCLFTQGEAVQVKYVSYDPSQAYPSYYEPRYHETMFYGAFFLFIAVIAGWSLKKEWGTRNANWAAKNSEGEASEVTH